MSIRCEQCGGINYYTYMADPDSHIQYGCKDCDELLETENDLALIRELTLQTKKLNESRKDVVNHPEHYISHPSGVECIEITEHMDFLKGNAIKYLWRSAEKGKEIEDLKKAIWYIERKIKLLEEGD